MPLHYRAFIATLVVTIFAIFATRWVIAGTSLYEPFERRRNYWIAAILITFLIPNFWVAMILVAALAIYASRKDKNPIAIFLFLTFALPPVTREIDKLGPINYLFALSPMRVLAIAIFVPLAYKLMMAPRARIGHTNLAPRVVDFAAVLLAVYMVAMYVPYESMTSVLRRTAMTTVDFVLPYFVISRYCRDREMVKDSLGALLTAGLIVGTVAVFEHFKGWLLWETITGFWGSEQTWSTLYLMRDDQLRASVTAGHQLILGYFLVVCTGLLGVFRPQLRVWRFLAALGILLLGLYSTVSRGPWIGALVVVLLAGLFTNNVRRYYTVLFGIGALATAVLLVSPYGAKFVNLLPIVGTVEQENVSYRKEILDTTLILVRQNPLFGSVRIYDQLEHLRQGQGIIDLVNVYAEFALTFGLIGLGLLVAFLFGGLSYAWRTCLRVRKTDRDLFLLAGNTGITLFGAVVLLAGISNWLSVPTIYMTLVALLTALFRIGKEVPARRAFGRRASQAQPVIEAAAP